MPPLAIAAMVPAAISSARSPPAVPGRSECRSRNSHTIDGGNLGARPNPPRWAS